MALTRVLRTAPVTLSHTFRVDETPTSAGAVTVAVKRLDGTAVASGAATPGGTGQYTYDLVGQAQLDTLTVDWSGSLGTERDLVEVVGGYLFDLVEARNQPPPLDATKYPTATLRAKRVEVEVECERICGVAFVPRYERVVLDGSGQGSLLLPRIEIRAVRSVTIGGALTTAVDFDPAGVLYLAGGASWPAGRRNVLVEYEHGYDAPPEDLKMAAMLRLRSRLTMTSSGVPDRAITWTAAEGGTYRIALPSKAKTGVPDVDAAYEGNTIDMGGFA